MREGVEEVVGVVFELGGEGGTHKRHRRNGEDAWDMAAKAESIVAVVTELLSVIRNGKITEKKANIKKYSFICRKKV